MMSTVAFPTARQPSCDGNGDKIRSNVEASINDSCRSPNLVISGGLHPDTPGTDVVIVAAESLAVDDPRRPPYSQRSITLSWAMESLPETRQPISSPSSLKKSNLLHSVKLPKKPSIQSLLTPSFLQQPPLTDSLPAPATRARSFSAVQRSATTHDLLDPPLLDIPASSLLDDDPFANLTSSHIPQFTESPSSLQHPILSEVPRPSTVVVSPQVYVPPATVARPRSSGNGQIRPAYTRPAFVTRPSLPSLHTLSQMNVTIPRKVRKGTPGARLPHEPWNMDLSAQLNIPTRNVPDVGLSRSQDNQTSGSAVLTQEGQVEDNTSRTTSIPVERLSSREVGLSSPVVADETCSSRSLSGDDADMDSLPSLSYCTSEPSSSALSRSSSIASSPWLEDSMDQNSPRDNHDKDVAIGAHIIPHGSDDIAEDDDPLSYHSDFDYYTQTLSDLSDFESDDDPASDNTRKKSSPDVTTTPQLPDNVDFEPGTSAETMRSNVRERLQTAGRPVGSPTMESLQDGGEWRGYRGEPERRNGGGEDRRGREIHRSNGNYSGGQSSGGYGGGAGGDDNKGDKPRERNSRSSDSSASDSTSSSDDDADGGTVYYSLDGMSNGPHSRAESRTQSRHSKAAGGSDDDVPLAQRVPTALSAQKSIRKQLRDEREQKKLERAKSLRTAAVPPLPLPPPESARTPASLPASYRKRSASLAPPVVSRSRVPSIEPFPVDDLTRKLKNLQTVQASSHTPPVSAPPFQSSTSPLPSSRTAAYGNGLSRSSSRGGYMDPATYGQKTTRTPEASSQDRPLRSARSFHRHDGRYSESPVESSVAPQLGRSPTVTGSSRAARTGVDAGSTGYEQYAKSGRASGDTRRPSGSVSRPSTDKESDTVQRVVQRSPLPPLPIIDSMTPQQPISRAPVVQQRIFIGDMQRFNIVEITSTTNAGEVIDIVASQGMIDRSTPWMLFEMAQDYGMERPIRDYETLADVSASWNKDKLLNAFVIKQTPLASILSRSAIPTSSPTHRGWVEWESKRGKWSKRWMELREHGLWLSKRDTGKDEVFLCSLSNFDAYVMTRRHKAPKGFVFAIKSTDHLSLFENAADYLHVFSCNPKDGEKWVQAILVARSYVLYQERHVLFAKTGESNSQSKPLARSRTRKQSVSVRPAQPLINVPPPFSQSPATTFEPGSLLAKRKGNMHS